jgi:hypothetical protein
MRRNPEKQIQDHICLMLNTKNFCYSVTNNDRTWGSDGKVRRSKCSRGWPDITGVFRGRFFGIEVKSAKGIVSELQEECHRKILANHGYVCVARNWEDCVRLFRKIQLDWEIRDSWDDPPGRSK